MTRATFAMLHPIQVAAARAARTAAEREATMQAPDRVAVRRTRAAAARTPQIPVQTPPSTRVVMCCLPIGAWHGRPAFQVAFLHATRFVRL